MKKCFVRLLSVLLTVALALSLAGCSSSNTEVTAKGFRQTRTQPGANCLSILTRKDLILFLLKFRNS